MSFPPGGLSTWKPPDASDGGSLFAIGSTYYDPNAGSFDDNVGSFDPLNIKDLACPTWGLGISGTSDNGIVITTIGPPWLPLISPPMEVFSLDPTWALLCTGVMTDPMNIPSLALFDPPIALTPGSGLVAPPVVPVLGPTSVPASNYADPTTVPNKEGTPPTEAAKPASSPGDPADPPARTGAPGLGNLSPSLAIASTDPAKSEAPPGDPVPSPTSKNDPPVKPNVPLPVIPAVSAVSAKDPPANPIVPSSDAADAQYGDPQNAPADSKAPAQPTPPQGTDAQQQTQGLGALIYNAFGSFGPVFGGDENDVNTISVPNAGINKVTIGGGQVLSVDPSGVTFQGKTYSIGGPAMTLSNSIYTLVAEHESGVDADDDGQNRGGLIPAAPDTLTIAGQTVVPKPTGMVIAGSSVLPGGSAVTISNTPISLAPSGVLVVGSSSFSLPPQSVFTVGVLPFIANPTGFVLNGATIFPGGAAQTVDGTRISLGQSGAFEIGSTTISLPTPSFPPVISTLTVAGQTFTPNPTALSIAGTTISAGGPAVTVAGTIISLGPSGTLIVGSSTIALLAPQTPLPSLPKIDGLSIDAQSSLAIVDGVTISPGAPGVTVDGSVVSLEAGGATLDIGTGRFAMPTEGANGSSGFVAFEGGQEKGVPVSLLLILLFGIGGTLMTLMG